LVGRKFKASSVHLEVGAPEGRVHHASSFTREARDFEGQVADALVLIDGARLTSLMIEYGIGVTHYRMVKLPKVDGDYFD
jgi:restriction system protein